MSNKNELTPRQAARILGVRLDSIYALIWADKIPARKCDGRWYLPHSAIQVRAKTKARLASTIQN